MTPVGPASKNATVFPLTPIASAILRRLTIAGEVIFGSYWKRLSVKSLIEYWATARVQALLALSAHRDICRRVGLRWKDHAPIRRHDLPNSGSSLTEEGRFTSITETVDEIFSSTTERSAACGDT